MKKTNKLFEQYFRLLNEQKPGEDPNAQASTPEQPPAEPAEEERSYCQGANRNYRHSF